MQNEQPKTLRAGIKALWIFALTLLGVGGGYFYAQSQAPLWQASAVFSAPKIQDVGNYASLFNTYQLVQNDGRAEPNIEKIISENSYAEFKRVLVGTDVRKQFLSQNAIVRQIAEVHYLPLDQLVNQLADKLHFDEAGNTLSIALVNPDQAVKLLEQFIVFSQTQARNNLNEDLIAKWKFLFQNVKQSAEANLGEGWQAKLNLMRSVQPLDGKLVPYHLVQKAVAGTKPTLPEQLGMALGIGGVLGFLLGLLFAFARRR